MTVKHIVPCVCTKHPPTAADKTTYGMPVLFVSDSIAIDGKQYWIAKCPVCGRGGLLEFNSSYLALKDWNDMQEKLYRQEGREIIYNDDWATYTDNYGNYLPQYKSKWDDL